MRLLNALNCEDRGVKVRFSLATIAFDRESAHMSQILNAPSDPYPHYLVRLATAKLGFSRRVLRSYVPHTKYKTPPNPKIHPEIHPKSPSKTEIQKKYEKNTKLGDFRIFFVFFLYFGFGGGFGVYFGVSFGVRRGFVFCMGHV